MKIMKPLLINFLCFGLVMSSVGCDALYRYLDKEGAEEKELVGDVVPFEPNPTVEEIQTLLKLYGYNSGKVDGILGLRTRDAIERFQKDNELKQTRFADDETWAKLKYFKDNNFIVENQLNVVLVQTALKEAGMNPGVIDGKFGKKTKRAVKKFQEAHQLKIDGKVGYQTLTKLSEFLPVNLE